MGGISMDDQEGIEVVDSGDGDAVPKSYVAGGSYRITSTLGRSARSVHILQLSEGSPAEISRISKISGGTVGDCTAGTRFGFKKSRQEGQQASWILTVNEGATAPIE